MKFFNIAILIVFMSLFVSCKKDDGNFYPYPDETGKVDDDTATPDKDKIEPDIDKIIVDEDLDTDDGDDIDMDEEADDDSFIPPVDDETDDDPGTPDPDMPDDDSDKILYGCGNGVTDLSEECDNGSFNTDAPGEIGVTCRTDCTYARCGDGIKDNGEFCDDGNILNGDYCSSDCMTATGRCGDGVVQTNEICDKAPYGNGIGSYCNDDCTEVSGSCGDGIVQDNEICDKAEFGAGTGPFYCAADCKKIIGSCGDGTVQPNEICDDGSNNGKYGFCNPACTGPGKRCGDGVKDWEGDEACDDGNTEDGDYCSADCLTLYGFCGDGAVQPNEECDKAVFGAGTGLYCSDDCKTVLGRCGDEIVQSNEQCDWGPKNIFQFCQYGEEPPCQRCNTVCNLVEGIPTYCGDGRLDLQNGEFCDKAEPDVGEGKGIGAYCSFDCTEVLGSCGDGVKQPHEECDKATTGDGIGPEYCSDDCTEIIGFCGDGVPQSNEMCDLGAGNTEYCEYGQTSCIVCNTSCNQMEGIPSLCGDGRTDAFNGELCDSGANNGSYRLNAPGHCNSDCLGIGAGGYCGDNLTQNGEGEDCDNGFNNGQLDCEYGLETCQVCSTSCKFVDGNVKFCGDGVVSNGEKCDDGELNGDYGKCRSDCTGIGNHCGDGQTTDSEVCDDGVNNGNYGYCAFDCMSLGKRCGDGTKQNEEVCDDGEDNGVYRLTFPGNCDGDCQGTGEGGYCGNSVTEAPFEGCDKGGDNGKLNCDYGQTTCTVCTSDCQSQNGTTSFCGDSKIDAGNGEKCDNGANNGNYGFCNVECTGMGPYCGDGNKTDGEFCDDGELNGTYGKCNTSCSAIGPHCGDAIQNGEEACDNGINNGKYGFCNLECTGLGERCGDDILQSSEGEICDDGPYNGFYGYCKLDCSGSGERCGDGIIQEEFESCDDGVLNGQYGKCKVDCSGINISCGDGVVQPEHEEVCDNGVNNGKYGYCKLDCSGLGERCGDEVIQDLEGEVCDHGINNGTYGFCKADCSEMGPYCGDESITDGEFCDDGANNGSYGYCSSTCLGLAERCGDGVIQAGEGEICDDGMNNGKQGYCKTDCKGPFEWCGDGITSGTEECDNGAENGLTYCPYGVESCKVCSNSCIESDGLTRYCGNSALESAFGEQCDDGLNNGKYKADYPGYCNSDCLGFGSGGYCGDGSMQSPEQCDNGVNNGNTICEYGLTSCDVCKNNCTTQPGIVQYCGDGVKQDVEQCDDGANNGQYNPGNTGFCNTDCQGKGAGGYCGDGTKQDSESCDEGFTVNGTYGHCKTDCSGLGERCGDGILQGEFETCDDGVDNGTPENCNDTCSGQYEGYCGDGWKNSTEFCDDGENNGNNEFCNSECTGMTEYCGDGILQDGEVCDHGENNGQPGYCLADCSAVEIYCGNGIPQTGELCDDGPNNGLYDPAGEGYCNSDCNGYNEGGYCGDGTTQVAEEECDDGLDNGLPGFCQADCTLPTDCGNGIIDEGEFCDTADVNCADFSQFSSGTVPCPADCAIPDFGGCVEYQAYINPFFTTSQTNCYDNTGTITCPAEGIPFYGQEPQFDYTIHSFTVNAETITENVTGLTWQKETPVTYVGCSAGDPLGSECSIADAWAYCDSLVHGGLDDWRLPTAFELSNIIDYSKSVPLIFDDFIGSVVNNYITAGYGYYMLSMTDGTLAQSQKSANGYVKCVRGDTQFANREIFQSDDMFIDILDSTVPVTVFWQYDSAQIAVDWEDALAYCSTLVVGGGGAAGSGGLSGFRLPTVVELQSFVFESLYTVPPLVGSGSFWTSTTVHATPANAYTVDFETGNVSMTGKTGTNFVICVK